MRPEQWAGTNITHIGSYAKKGPRNVQMWEKQGLFKFLFISCIGIQMLTIFVNFRISTNIPKAEFETKFLLWSHRVNNQIPHKDINVIVVVSVHIWV